MASLTFQPGSAGDTSFVPRRLRKAPGDVACYTRVMNAHGTASGLVPVATGGSSSVQLDEYGDPYLVWSWDVSASLDRKFVYDLPLTGDGCAASDFGSAASHVKVGWNLLLELNALNSDAIIRRYTWGLDLSGQSGNAGTVGLHAAGGIGGLLGLNDVSASKNYIYFMDANGNVMQLLDSSNGSIAARYEFYSYGGELVATGSAATANPFRFSSKYWDTEAQVYYFGFRYLRPKMGRWLNRDPLFISTPVQRPASPHGLAVPGYDADEVQAYPHTSNRPVNGIDPVGMKGLMRLYPSRQDTTQRCGKFDCGFFIHFPNGAPCDGYLVQEVFAWLSCRDCNKKGTPTLTDNPQVHYFEVIPILRLRPGHAAPRPEDQQNLIKKGYGAPIKMDTVRAQGKEACKGSYAQTGSVRFFCRTKQIDNDIQSWVAYGGGSLGTCCGEQATQDSGTFPATNAQPSWWSNHYGQEQVGRAGMSTWNCCCPPRSKLEESKARCIPSAGIPSG